MASSDGAGGDGGWSEVKSKRKKKPISDEDEEERRRREEDEEERRRRSQEDEMWRQEDERRSQEDDRRREEDERRREEDERRQEADRRRRQGDNPRRRQEGDVLNIGGLSIGNPKPPQDLIWVKGRSSAQLKMKMNVIKEEDDKADREKELRRAEIEAARAKAAGKKVEEAVAAKETVDEANTRFSLEFRGFLTSFKKNGSEEFQYPAQIATMKRLKSYVLNVDFLDILSDKKYKNLAIRLGESTEYLWLHKTIAEFLIANGMDEDIDELLQKVSLSFTNMHRLKALNAHMRSKPCWKTTKNSEKTLTAHGRISFSLLICDVLKKNKENISHNGDFNEDDILLGETFCWIYSKQLQDQLNLSYLADLSSTWTVMETYYELKPGSKTYPQNLDELMDSLYLVGIDPSEVRSIEYIDFMWYHPSLASSIAKRTFTTELRRAVRDQRLENESFLSRIPIGAWQQWSKKRSKKKWTEKFEDSLSPVLRGVYWYDPNIGESTSEGQQVPAAKTTAKGQLTSIPKGPPQVKKISAKGVATSSQVEKEMYPNTVWGMLDYKRCVIEHGKEHGEGEFVYESASSVEIHASGALPGLLAYLLYTMLKKDLFRKGNRLAFLFETYKRLFGAADD